MSKVNYLQAGDTIYIGVAGKHYQVKKGDVRYAKIEEAIRSGQLDDIQELVDTGLIFKRLGLELRDGLLYMDGDALPETLSNRVIDLVEHEMPVDIMLKFWQNLKQNPSFNSRKMLYKFLEHNGHPLTEDGCFIAYRGVTADFKDCHTGRFDNSVGSVCEMDRSQVDENPNNTCSHGLHVACFSYANSFGQQLVEVKVNPRDVVAVPEDYNGTKMRVCKFEVVAVGEKELTGPVYGYSHDELVDDDYDSENYEDQLDENYDDRW